MVRLETLISAGETSSHSELYFSYKGQEGEGGGGDYGVVGGGCSAFPLTGGSHTRFKREENSNWLLCCPASLGLVSTKRATGKYLFLSIWT